MPFTAPAFYFRTEATRVSIIPDPSDLPAAQILQFDSNGINIVELVEDNYQNNVPLKSSNTNPLNS